MPKKLKIDIAGHCVFFDENTHHLAGLVLRMIRFMEFDYPPSYKKAIDAQFPGLFEKANELSNTIEEVSAWSHIDLNDDEVYSLYTCYDLMGRLYVSDLYDKVMDEIYKEKPSPLSPEVMKQVYQHTLANIQPFLVGTELYAKKTNKLPLLGNVKKRLDNLPLLN